MSTEVKNLTHQHIELVDKPIDLGQDRLGLSMHLGGDFVTLLESPEPILPALPVDEKANALQKVGILEGWFTGIDRNPPPPIWSIGKHREKVTAAVVRQVLNQAPNVQILGADIRESPPGSINVDLRQKLAAQLGLPAEQIKVSDIGDRLVGREKSMLIVIRSQGEKEAARATQSVINKLRKDHSVCQLPFLVSANQRPSPRPGFWKRLRKIS